MTSKMDYVKRRIIISMGAIVLLIITLVGITYAYFTAKVEGNTNDKSVSVNAGFLRITYGDGNGNVTAEKIIPGKVIEEKTFTVQNTGTHPVENYDVFLENVINELEKYEDLTYELTCTKKDGSSCNGSSGIFPKTRQVIATNTIEAADIHNYKIVVTYNETNQDQSIDMNKTIDARINIKDDNSSIKKLKIYGNSIQNGTPTIDNPVEIMSLGNVTDNILNTNNILTKSTSGANTVSYEFVDNNLNTKYIPNAINNNYSYIIYNLGKVEDFDSETINLIMSVAGDIEYSYIGIGYANNTGSKSGMKYFVPTKERKIYSFSVDADKYSGLNVIVTFYACKTTTDLEINKTYNIQYINPQIVIGNINKLPNYEPYGYKIPITVRGKNLLQIKEDKTVKFKNVEISVNAKTQKFKVVGTAISSGGRLNYLAQITLPPGTYHFSTSSKILDAALTNIESTTNPVTWKNRTFTLTETTTLGLGFNPLKDTVYDEEFTIQIEEGSYGINVVREWEPYIETVNYIYLDEPLRKIGDYADYIDLENGVVVRQIKSIKANNNELLKLESPYVSMNEFDYNFSVPYDSTNVNLFMSNIGAYEYKAQHNGNFHWIIGKNYWNIYSPSSDVNLNDYFKSINFNDNIEFNYVLLNKEIEELPRDVQEYNLLNNKINVCTDNGVCASNIEIEYDN